MSIVPLICEFLDLADLLREVASAEERLKALPARREALAHRLHEPAARVASAESKLQQARESERAVERRLRELQQQQQRYRQQLQEVASQREADSLQHQLDRLAAEVAAAEDEGLAALTTWEQQEAELPRARQALEAAREELARLTAQLNDEEQRLMQSTELARAEQAARRKGLDAEAGALWDLLAPRYGHTAVAAIAHPGVCSGCDMSLMPAVRSHAMMMREVSRCPSCGRVLYDPERVAAEGRRAPRPKRG